MTRFAIAVGLIWAVFSVGFVFVDGFARMAPASPLAQFFKRSVQ